MKNDKALKVIILIVITAIFVTLAIVFRKDTKTLPKVEESGYDTKMFINIDVKEALELFNQKNTTSIIFLGRQTCEVCAYQGPYLQVAIATYHFNVYHIDIEKIDYESKEYEEFVKKLDYEYELEDKKGSFGSFMGYTPMIVIIRNGKQVYGHLGILTDTEIYELALTYGVI